MHQSFHFCVSNAVERCEQQTIHLSDPLYLLSLLSVVDATFSEMLTTNSWISISNHVVSKPLHFTVVTVSAATLLVNDHISSSLPSYSPRHRATTITNDFFLLFGPPEAIAFWLQNCSDKSYRLWMSWFGKFLFIVQHLLKKNKVYTIPTHRHNSTSFKIYIWVK